MIMHRMIIVLSTEYFNTKFVDAFALNHDLNSKHQGKV